MHIADMESVLATADYIVIKFVPNAQGESQIAQLSMEGSLYTNVSLLQFSLLEIRLEG